MIKEYQNQSVSWKTAASSDEYCQSSYVTATSIPARYEYSRKEVINREGQKVISEAVCFSETAIKTGDIITFDGREWPVISVKNEVDLKGNVKFYEARL